MTGVRAAREPVLWLVMTLASAAAFAAETPQYWLDRMNAALTTRNYVGVFSHWQSGQVETLRIVHRVVDGTVTERLESLDGSGRQFVSDGTELTCYLPDQRTVLVEKAPQSLLPAGLTKFAGQTAGLLPAGQPGHDAPDGREGAGDHGHAPRWFSLRVSTVDPTFDRHAAEDRTARFSGQCN